MVLFSFLPKKNIFHDRNSKALITTTIVDIWVFKKYNLIHYVYHETYIKDANYFFIDHI